MFPDYSQAISQHLDIIEYLLMLMGKPHIPEAAQRAQQRLQGVPARPRRPEAE